MNLIPGKGRRGKNGEQTSSPSSLSSLRRGIDEVFSRFWDDPWGGLDLSLGPGWTPSFDVVDGEKEVTVHAELPGVDAKDLDVTVAGGMLTVTGEKKSEHEENGKDFYRSERVFGSFRRAVQLPEGADPDKVTAEFSNGVLTVRIAKSVSAQPKRIVINQK